MLNQPHLPKYRHYRPKDLAVVRIDGRTRPVPIPGELPGAVEVAGCKFHPRCGACEDRCRSEEARLRSVDRGREVACHVVAPHSR